MLKKKMKLLLAIGVVVIGTVSVTNAGVFYPYGSNSYAGYQNPCTNNSSHAQIPLTYGKEPTPPYERHQQKVECNSTNTVEGAGTTINVGNTQKVYYKTNNTEERNGYDTVNGHQDYLANDRLSSGWGSDGHGKFIRGTDNRRLTGWQRVNGYWYYFSTDGYMRTGWQKVNGKWYLLDNEGKMQTGWKQLNGSWYLLGKDGDMKTGWQKANGKWYFLSSNGTMRTGWIKVGGKWYFLANNGEMKTGWLKQGNKWYFLKSDGSMMTQNFKLGTTVYHVSSSGECTW